VYGGLRIRDGHEITFCAPSCNTAGWLHPLQQIAHDNPRGQVRVVTDNLSSHTSRPIQDWLTPPPTYPTGVHSQSGLLAQPPGRLVATTRPRTYAGQTFADPAEIEHATTNATAQLNTHAKPWTWGRPPPPTRKLRRKFVYFLNERSTS
jgi:hypothetical protein